MTRTVGINRDRLWASLMGLKDIGAYDDEATGLRGVRRPALTDADAEARRRCVEWMLDAGLDMRVDRIGKVYATLPGRDRSLPWVLMGSHIDTVATGGAFDGTLGVPISWQRLTIWGEAAHAGTTPITSRHNAGLVAASVVVEARRMCDGGDFGQLRATVGNFDIGEGQTNVIPHEATVTLDLRNPVDDLMTAAEQHLAGYVDELAARHGVQVAWERMAKTAVVPFHPDIQDLLAATADDLGPPYARASSGAGHDAQEIAAICPTAMVLVAGENGGISHTPREYSNAGACADGTDMLANAALRLADQP